MKKRQPATELGPLPIGWTWKRLDDLLDAIEAGKSFSVEGASPKCHEVGIMKVSAVTWGKYDEKASKVVHDPTQINPKYFVRPGDLLFSRANTIDLVGAVVLVERVTRDIMLSDKILRLCMPQDFKKWTLFALRSPGGRKQIEALATGNQESMRNIGQEQIRQIAIPTPPLAEQRRLVVVIEIQLERLDRAVASLTRARANIKRARASVLTAAVEGRLVPTEAALALSERRPYEPASTLLARILTERRARWADGRGTYKKPVTAELDGVGQLPLGWVWASCDQAGEILLGRRRAPEYTGSERPYLRVANVKDGLLSLVDVQQMPFEDAEFEKYQLQPGDILVSEGQSPELVGQSALYLGAPSPCAFQATLHRFRPDPTSVLPRYAETVFRAWVRGGVFRKRCIVTTNIGHLTLGRFKSVPFPLPPLAEQHRIVTEVDRRLSVLDAIELTVNADLARCSRLRQSILKRAFEGRLVPHIPATASEQQLLFAPQDAPR